ncbi:MAG: hypothetical protein IJ057_12415 [Bacteroidales bacterium]|nr:hypothetical protein [Bacteroidales bacterium]
MENDKKATGYTKHYFAGTERLASAIGNGGLADIGIVGSEGLADKRRERDTVMENLFCITFGKKRYLCAKL